MKHYGVIMAGGGGTRFWPLSRQAMPKQMLNLSGKDRMINETIDRLDGVIEKSDMFIVTNEKQAWQNCKRPHSGRAVCKKYGSMHRICSYGDRQKIW